VSTSQSPGGGSELRKLGIFSYLDPASNPRVPKEAEALAAAGYEVTVVTSCLPGSNRIQMPPSDVFRVHRLNRRSLWWGRWRHRLMHRTAPLWPRSMRPSVAAYGSLFVDLVRHLKSSSEHSIRIAHLEPAFLAAEQAGCFDSICCDFEDWYSEDLLPGRRSAELTVALKTAERLALNQSLGCWCTSQAMAAAFAEAFQTEEPLVVRNVFPRRFREAIDGRWADRPAMAKLSAANKPSLPRPPEAPVSFHWFSQTIGPGRGLEEVFAALCGMEGDWELHLRGSLGNYGTWLETNCPHEVRGRVKLHALAGTDELTSRIAEHDVGLACEARQPRSRDVTITNKVFQYLQAGLAVVASDTSGQKEVAHLAPGAVELYRTGDPESLRMLLQQLVLNREKLKSMRGAAWEAGALLCWENEAPKLVEAVEKALDRRSATR
jgi:glycosyltransferase involved in cell wall biosynthesis